jgi:single-stranded-DNA-specific exonuclease
MIWSDPQPLQPDPQFTQHIGGHPLVARILTQRGFASLASAQAFLSPSNYRPAPPDALPDLITAAEHLSDAINTGQSILIWGDFDVDGQTATALLVDALQRLDANVHYYIPDRLRESHGIRVDSLQKQIKLYQPSVLLTCDTGISAHTAIDYAKSQGVITLVTDHHYLPAALPAADAVVNPKRLPGGHALTSLPGVGVAYKVIEYLFTAYDRRAELTNFLDLVALGIVADVAQQTQDTRYLLQIGLERLRQSQRVGVQALIDVAGLASQNLTAADIGFQLGPRLNAAGRLGDARPVVELLTTHDSTRARLLAAQLEGLNTQRRLQNRQIYAAAQEQIARDPSLLDWEALVLACLL